MCILAFTTNYCERFPFILISNRDEQLSRTTAQLALDVKERLLWAVDSVGGGSWMGLEPRSGRFAVLTNCRRAPSAPLVPPVSPLSPWWRGAAPLHEILSHTKIVRGTSAQPSPLLDVTRNSTNGLSLAYQAPTSRGTIVHDYLQKGWIPGDGAPACKSLSSLGEEGIHDRACGDSIFCNIPVVVQSAPYYAGFNLLSCESLYRGADDLEVELTSNRFTAPHRQPVSKGEVHCLQNSFMDNFDGEPASNYLKDLFTTALHNVIEPFCVSSTAGPPVDVIAMATALADQCLCAQPNFNVEDMIVTAPRPQAEAMISLLESSNPLLGLSEADLRNFAHRAEQEVQENAKGKESLVGGGATVASERRGVSSTVSSGPSSLLGLPNRVFSDGGAREREAYLQSNILKLHRHGYGTRVQSVVLTERVLVGPAEGSSLSSEVGSRDRDMSTVVYFAQRGVGFDDATQQYTTEPWTCYTVTIDGVSRCAPACSGEG